jgi:hypothetical protein
MASALRTRTGGRTKAVAAINDSWRDSRKEEQERFTIVVFVPGL